MKILKEIAGRIFALWALVWFIVTMLLFFIPFLSFCYFLPDPKKTHRFIRLSRAWMNVFLTLIGCPVRVKGKENFTAGQNYIVVCNHNSFMDVPISTPFIPGGNKTIAKIEMSKIPLFGLIYKTGSVLVDRKSDQSRKESYLQMKEVLNMGLHMCLYPEGTRNKTDQPLKSFHDGAFRLSLNTGRSLLPGIIFHTRNVLPPGKLLYLMPHPLAIHFLPPIAVLPNDTIETLKERTRKIMEDHFRSVVKSK